MKRYSNNYASIGMDKAIICYLDLPKSLRIRALAVYKETLDLDEVVKFIKEELRKEDKEKMLKEIEEYKANAD